MLTEAEPIQVVSNMFPFKFDQKKQIHRYHIDVLYKTRYRASNLDETGAPRRSNGHNGSTNGNNGNGNGRNGRLNGSNGNGSSPKISPEGVVEDENGNGNYSSMENGNGNSLEDEEGNGTTNGRNGSNESQYKSLSEWKTIGE